MACSVEWISEGLRFRSPGAADWIVVPTGGFVHTAALIGDPASTQRAWALTGPRSVGGDRQTLVLFDLSRRTIIATHDFEKLRGMTPLPSRDGKRVFVAGTGIEGEPQSPSSRSWPEVSVVDVETGEMESSFQVGDNFWFYGQQAAEATDGRVRIPAFVTGGEPGSTSIVMVTIDWRTRTTDVAQLCGSRPRCWLSPTGKLALTPDFTRLPVRDEQTGPLSGLGFGARKRYYGLPMQIWDAQSASFLRSVTVAWFGEEDLPPISSMWGKSRVEPYERLRALCDALPPGAIEGPDETVGPFSEDKELQLLRELHRTFAAQLADTVSWADDEQQFWVRAHGFVSCVHIEGTASPRMRLARTGMKSGMVVPFAHGPAEVHPLGGDRARLLFGASVQSTRRIEAEAEIKARIPSIFAAIEIIPESRDEWRDVRTPSFEEQVRALVNELQAATIRIRDLSAAQCVRAINSLVKDLPRHLEGRTHNTLDFFFELPDRTLDEEQFFDHVEANVPEAVGSLRKLLDRILTVCPELPYASNDRQLLAPAVRALGVLDQTALPKVGVYGARWDEEHATYFTRKLLPAVVAAHGWTEEVVALGLKAMLRDDDRAEVVWRKLGMRAALEQSTSPETFAADIVSELKANPPEELFRFGHYALLKLWESAGERSAWEERLFAELDRTPGYDYPNEAWDRARGRK